MPTTARLICVRVEQFTSVACNWEIMLHQFSQLSVEIPPRSRRDTDNGRSERCAFAFCIRHSQSRFAMHRAILSAARSRPTCSCNTPVRSAAGAGGRGTTNFHVLAQKSNGIARVKCNASLARPGLTSPHSIIFPRNFPCRRLLITFLTITQPRISSRKFDRDGVKILRERRDIAAPRAGSTRSSFSPIFFFFFLSLTGQILLNVTRVTSRSVSVARLSLTFAVTLT